MKSIQFSGQLHEVTLVNFSVDPAELKPLLPKGLQARRFDGRALISMVDVQLRDMKADKWWMPFRFHYHHVAFRLLIEDAQWTEDHAHHGICFLQSFIDRPLLMAAGNLMSDYKFQAARFVELPAGLKLYSGGKFLHYNLAAPILNADEQIQALKSTVGAIDRAYAPRDGKVYMTRILREQWPLKAMDCNRFETNFFESARLEGAFKVPTVIDYTWLPAAPVAELGSPAQAHPSLQLAVR